VRAKPVTIAWVRGGFLALILGAVCPAATGQGTIVFQTPGQPIYYGPVEGSHNLDLNGDGITDYVLFFGISRAGFTPPGINSVGVDGADLVVPLNRGDLVSANPSSLDPAYVWYDPQVDGSSAFLGGQNIFDGQYFYSGNWSGVDGFVGLRFQYEGTMHYGWMEIANSENVASGQVLGWAYETRPDTPIFAGQVPEPGTFSLLLIFGAAFWLVRKHL
jgi:hypothetical protein